MARSTLESRWAMHPAMTPLLPVLDAYEEALSRARDDVEDDAEAERLIDGSMAPVRAIQVALGEVDVDLVSNHVAANIAKQISGASTYLTNEGIRGVNFTASSDAVRDAMVPLVSLPKRGRKTDVYSSAAARTNELVRDLEDRILKLDEEVAALATTATDAEVTVVNLQSQADETVEAVKEKANAALLDVELDSAEKASAKIEEIEVDRVAIVHAAESALDNADETLVRLRRKLSLAADISLSAGYRHAADAELAAAEETRGKTVFWAVLAALVAVGMVGVQVYLIAETDESAGTLAVLLVPKLLVTGAVAAIAAYYGRESSGHRREGERLRQVQLELENIGEYLSELDPEERSEARKSLIPRFFQDHQLAMGGNSPTIADAVQPLAEAIVNVARESATGVSD